MNLKGQMETNTDFIEDFLPIDEPGKSQPLYQGILFLFYD